jgi:hypothetical protein
MKTSEEAAKAFTEMASGMTFSGTDEYNKLLAKAMDARVVAVLKMLIAPSTMSNCRERSRRHIAELEGK